MLNGTIGDVITSMDAKTIRTGSDVFRLLDKRALALWPCGLMAAFWSCRGSRVRALRVSAT